jgi:hypothetical protein
VYRVHKGAAAWLLVLEMQNARLVHWLVVCCDRVLCWAAVLLAFSSNVWLRHSSIMISAVPAPVPSVSSRCEVTADRNLTVTRTMRFGWVVWWWGGYAQHVSRGGTATWQVDAVWRRVHRVPLVVAGVCALQLSWYQPLLLNTYHRNSPDSTGETFVRFC